MSYEAPQSFADTEHHILLLAITYFHTFKVSAKQPANDMVAAYMAEKEKYRNIKKENTGKKGSSREQMTLAMLTKFQSKLNSAKVISGGYSDEEEEEAKGEKKEEEGEEEEEGHDASWCVTLCHNDICRPKHQKLTSCQVNSVMHEGILIPLQFKWSNLKYLHS